MSILGGIKKVLSDDRYYYLFLILLGIFIWVYIFSMNLIYFPSLYIDWDNWTVSNIFFWGAISLLSGLLLTLNIYNIKKRLASRKAGAGMLAVIPAFLISSCPTCVPLFLSFLTSTLGIGFALASANLLIQIITTSILLVATLYISAKLGKPEVCEVNNSVSSE